MFHVHVSISLLHVSDRDIPDDVLRVLQECSSGIAAIEDHERSLFEKGLISHKEEEKKAQYGLLDLESTLLMLASCRELTEGVLYCLAVPDASGKYSVRYLGPFFLLQYAIVMYRRKYSETCSLLCLTCSTYLKRALCGLKRAERYSFCYLKKPNVHWFG